MIKIKDEIPWNRAETLGRLGGDEALFQDVLNILLSEVPDKLETLRRAIAGGEAGMEEQTAHWLKGELGYFGFTTLSRLAGFLEEMGTNHQLQGAQDIFTDVQTT